MSQKFFAKEIKNIFAVDKNKNKRQTERRVKELEAQTNGENIKRSN